MKKIALFLLLIPCILLLSSQRSQASHAVGANITYTHDTLNTYIVTVKFYRDCTGAAGALPTTNIPVDYSSTMCGLTGSAILNAVPGTGNEISPGLYPPCYVTSCQGGLGYGVQEWVYSGPVTLPGVCSDWVIATTINARNTLITTINNIGGGLSMYVETTLDNLNYPNNSSPVFSTYPVSTFCINHPFTYNQGATDADGDSLVFSLVDALSGSGMIVPYYSPYNGANPFSSSTGVTINSQTGLISFTPNVVQVGVMAVLIQEYRNGILIGTVRRDMQVNIEATCNFPPVLEPSSFSAIVANCLDSILYIHLTTRVRCNSIALDGSDFRMLSPGGVPIPIVSETPINCQGGMTDSIKLKLYNPALFQNGTYFLWSKVGNDGNTLINACGSAMSEYDTATFFFHNCYDGVVDLKNVSVNTTNKKMEVYWTAPANLPVNQFYSYDIYRSNYPGGPYYGWRSLLSASATSYTDDSLVNVTAQPYNYAVRIHLHTGYISELSDSIQSIFMTGSLNADSTSITLQWTPYWGWPNPDYIIYLSDDDGATFNPVSGSITSNTSYLITKPELPGKYVVRVHTYTAGGAGYVSRSNWFKFDVIKTDVIASNILTPNGDGKNDAFIFSNLEMYPNSKLMVFNRWGKKVYESSNYRNDWKGDELAEGVYYYTMTINDKNKTEINGTVNILRGK